LEGKFLVRDLVTRMAVERAPAVAAKLIRLFTITIELTTYQ